MVEKERWPAISQSDLADVCREICESILELERAYETGQLSSLLTSGCFEQVFGPRLYAAYENLANTAPGPLHHLRTDALRALLEQLQNYLLPTQVAQARLRMSSEEETRTTELEPDRRPTLPFNLVDASFDDVSNAPLRLDQMIDRGFWRIGFAFEERHLNDAFAQEVIRRATGRTSNELLNLQKIIERFNPRDTNNEIRIVPYPRQRRFEHLVLDILNEDRRRARVATLVEDFLEKTDLRVTYPELNRKRGARVQITSIDAPRHHDTKLQAIRLAEELVFLSPLTLAEFVVSLQARTPSTATSDTSSFSLPSLWDCLEAKPADAPQLASELKRIMFLAMTGPPDSPFGPMARVPAPIRQLIRLFVETRAFDATNRLRERLAASSFAAEG